MVTTNSDNFFDTPPMGYTRDGTKRGWALPVRTPQTGVVNRLKKDNQELSDRLAKLEDMLQSTDTASSKKKGKANG